MLRELYSTLKKEKNTLALFGLKTKIPLWYADGGVLSTAHKPGTELSKKKVERNQRKKGWQNFILFFLKTK